MSQKSQEFVLWDRNYCSDNVASRAIEPLAIADETRVSSLKQVQVIHRHGARSVASVGNCFGNYKVEMNCSELHEVIGSNIIQGDDHGTIKINYDMGENVYKGTCNTGQLLEKGAEQEVQNGKNLKAAYVGNNSGTNLWDTIPDISSNQVFLYSTDVMRTRQSLLHSMKGFFDYNTNMDVEVHSRDSHNDPWKLSRALCPILEFERDNCDVLWVGAQDTNYRKFAVKWKDTYGVEFAQECWDHVFSALCANWTLPPELQNQTSSFFKATINYGSSRAKSDFLSNYTKVYVRDIMQDIKLQWKRNKELAYPSLVIWSAHDTTIASWLHAFSVWDQIYPPFASIITIEIYEMAETESFNYGFRLTYQGKPITQNMTECPADSEICDLDLLLDRYPNGTNWTSYCVQEVPATKAGNSAQWDMIVGVVIGVASCAGLVLSIIIISKLTGKNHKEDNEYNSLN